MERRRVRIYKAENGGNVMNPLSNFIARAQYGTQQQQVDPQQLVMQVVSLIAPVDQGGQGNDPNQVYTQLAQTYGEEVASNLINAAAQYLQQMQSDSSMDETVQTEQPLNDQLSIQEDLIAEEKRRQQLAQDEEFAQEDDEYLNELLYAKEGGFIDKLKNKFVRSTVKLAKKQLGDTIEQPQETADSTDIMDGRQKKTTDFLSSIKKNVVLSQIEKQAENLFEQQFGGMTGGDLYKFVYGGNDPSIPDLTRAQTGLTVTDKWGNTKTLSQEEADYWKEQSAANPELRLSDLSFTSEAPKSSTNTGLTEEQELLLNAGKLGRNPYQGYYFNPVPYSTDNIFDALLPFNRSRKKFIPGAPYYLNTTLPFTGPTDQMPTGFSMTKERLGPGAKKYTYRPLYDKTEETDQADSTSDLTKEKRSRKRNEDRQGPLSNLGEKLKYSFMKSEPGKEKKVPGVTKKGFLGSIKKAQYGLQKFQGIDQGNQVNNQNQDIPFLKPKSMEEVWDKTRPEIMKEWGIEEPDSDRFLKDWEQSTYEIKEFDPQQALLATNVIGNKVGQIAEMFDKGRRQAMSNMWQGQTMDNIAPDTFYTQPGTYFANAERAFRGQKPGAPQGEGFEGIVKYGGPIMAKGGTPYPQRFGSLAIIPTAMGGNDIDQYIGEKKLEVRDSIGPQDRRTANLEAEGGETAFGDINGDGFPEHYKITGPRHSSGGVPLNLPDGTFIFSDTRSMKITDPKILKMFNKPPKKGGYTPADLAKQYDINSYRKILQDPNTDKLEKKTAELMIKQFNIKLGALALAQESKKGFPQGIPEVARPYMESMGLKDADILPESKLAEAQATPEEMNMMAMTSEEGMPAQDEMMQAPMAQNGIIQRTSPEMQNYIDIMNKYYHRKGMDEEYLPSKVGPMTEEQMENWNSLQEILDPSQTPGRPSPARNALDMGDTPQDRLNRMRETTEDCPCMREELVNGTIEKICVPCEQMPMAMYGMTMGGYDLPFAQSNYMYKNGGQLDKYQDKGEVKTSPKVYTKESLPEGAVVKTSKDAWNLKTGDFVLQSDGTYRKVTAVKFDPRKVAVDTQTKKQTVQDFINQSPENKQIIEKANAIIEKGIKEKTILCLDKSCTQIRITGKFNPGFQDRITLSRALNSNANFGTDKYLVKKQSATEGYSRSEKGAYKGTGSFVAGFTPEDYEKRFIFEKARGAGNSDEEAFAIVDQVYADPTLKAKFRRDYLTMLGVTNIPTTDEELLKSDFYKTRYAEVTRGIEKVLSKEGARPVIGDEQLSGFEHFDAFGFSPDVKYEYSPGELQEKEVTVQDPEGNMMPINVPVPQYAPWWLQDTIATAGAFNRMYSRQDQYPSSQRIDFEEPRGPFLDPAREIAAREESTNKALSYLSKTMGAQNYGSVASKLMGEESRDIADILSRYNDANVQLARQDEYAGVDIRNKEAAARAAAAKQYVDEMNYMLAKKQNTKLADKKYLEDQLKSAITNRWKTDALNQLYPDYAVDPSIGGKLMKKPNYKSPRPEKGTELEDLYQKYYNLTKDEEQATKLAIIDYNKSTGSPTSSMYPAEAIMSMYDNRKEGGNTAGGMYVMGSNVFPFMFY